MSTLARMLRYPRLVIAAGYLGLVLSSLGLGMTLAGRSRLDVAAVFPSVSTMVIAVFVLHHAYTTDRGTWSESNPRG